MNKTVLLLFLVLAAALGDASAKAPINLVTEGAVGDGVTDNTAVFQRVLGASNVKAYLPNGTYLTSTVNTGPGLKLTGESRTAVLTSSTGGAILNVGSGTAITLLSIVGTWSQTGINEQGDGDTSLTDIVVKNVGFSNLFYGVNIDHVNGFTVTKSDFDNSWYNGDYRGINITFSNSGVLSHNVIKHQGHGIQFWGNWEWNPDARPSGLEIFDNRVADVEGGGIWGTGYLDVNLYGNHIRRAGDVGLDFEWCEGGSIHDNDVAQTANAGISLFFSSSYIDIHDNVVNNNGLALYPGGLHYGIWITGTNTDTFPEDFGNNHFTIDGNTIYQKHSVPLGNAIHLDTPVYDYTLGTNTVEKKP